MNGKIPTGSRDLDLWLNGGYEKDVITTLYGPAGSGKSNFCIMAAVRQAAIGKKVIFIDTEGGFSVERMGQLASPDAMKNIFLIKVTSFAEQIEAFKKLISLAKGEIGLIVVDSIVMLYRLEINEASQSRDDEKAKEINHNLAMQMRILNEISRKKEIPVLVTDQVYSKFLSKEEFAAGKEKQVAMIGGDIIKYWSKCIIELQNLGRKRKAIVRKHRSLPEKEIQFEIIDSGIRKKGLF